MLNQIIQALLASAGILWKSFWALVFGYTISAVIQVLVNRSGMARVLGKRSWKQVTLAGLFGFISSSCSLAAIAVSRSILVKGAHPVNALCFLIASTNLVIELGIVLWVLLGWQFLVGNFLLGILMIVYAYMMNRFWFPKQLAEKARQHAQIRHQGKGIQHNKSLENKNWWQKLSSKDGWRAIADAFFEEWKIAYKGILIGFIFAGLIYVFVPTNFWDTLFLQADHNIPSLLTVIENALIAPIIVCLICIDSMGSIPIAALLWSKNASFDGVMSFLGADLVAATAIYLQVKYYGWKYAAYLSGLLYVCIVAAAITVHEIFALCGALPVERATLTQVYKFHIDYTFWLNMIFAVFGGVLLWLHWQNKHVYQAGNTEQYSQQEVAKS
ncbi:permease [Chlorogloeopsis sp. ULAP01]|uniref:permease n=1 Tax=Chlorogloeopsis sp. ULAP01 TaxID=3056483 RepID=UPI0025ABCB12|nr:permease [Chlorogloeopsis sp. ULAP01]